MRTIATWMLAAAMVAGIAAGAEARGAKGKIDLTASASTPSARGKASVAIKSASDGKFEVQAQKLAGNVDYDLLVGGVKVATLHTSRSGSARAKFASKPSGKVLLLGFDPRGESIEIRHSSGDDSLTGNMPEVGEDPADVTCCIPDDRGPECEDRTQAECDAQGGTVVTAGSCLPDPCGGTPPPARTTVCCIPDDTGPECEDRTQAECTTAGGTIVEATSCTPNPCQGTPPPPDADIQCCIPAYYVFECEDRTVAECEAAGGINKGPGTCSPNPCGALPPPGHNMCCLPNAAGDEIECEDRAPADCTAAGGVNKGTGVCAVDTCADVPPPNPDVMCCLPNATGSELECEDRTAAQCDAQGGVNKGVGVCAPDTCGAPAGPDIACCEPHSQQLECRARSAAECALEGGTNVGDTCTPTSCDGL